MNKYLARLKGQFAEKRPPDEPTELTKEAFVSSVSTKGSYDSENEAAIEERAGLAAGRVADAYLDAWARLNHQRPQGVSEAEWRQTLDDGGRFLDNWSREAARMGWTPRQLFDVAAGLIWRLRGERVTALGPKRVVLEDGREVLRLDQSFE